MAGRRRAFARKQIPGAGPYGARLLHVGEAAGPQETARGIPFIGPTGAVCRKAYMAAGLATDRWEERNFDVRWNNVVPFNPGRLTPGYAKALLREHWDNIAVDLARAECKAIVACGGMALQRLTGLTNIPDEHGGVIPVRELPKSVLVAGEPRALGYEQLLRRVPDAVVVACLHPAGVMQTKVQGQMIQVERVLWRAAKYALGELALPRDPATGYIANALPEIRMVDADPADLRELDAVLAASQELVIDTEFDRETKEPFLCGVLGGARGGTVFISRCDREAGRYPAMDVIGRHFQRGGVRKIAHFVPADIGSLARLGFAAAGGATGDDGWPGWFCTLHNYAALYPDAEKGLNHVALDYTDDQRNWKGRSTDDPVYLALDVWNCWRAYLGEQREIAAAGPLMRMLVEDEIPVAICEMERLEREGLRVDRGRQQAMIRANVAERDLARTQVQQEMAEVFAGRGARVKRKLPEIRAALATALASLPAGDRPEGCEVHPSYDGCGRKRWSAADACTCRELFDAVSEIVEREPLRPFNPTNDHDMRWLLYDKRGLGLPAQRDRDTGNLTVSATAVQRLTVRMLEARAAGKRTSKYWRADAEELVRFIGDCKRVKHLDKERATFLELRAQVTRWDETAKKKRKVWVDKVDEAGYAHPSYRAYAAASGRPGGGADKILDGDKDQTYSYNALNIPKHCRSIYVPDREDWVWVYADWSSMESWLTAYFSQDAVLWGELAAHLAGVGSKPHELNAALIFDCDPAEVHTKQVVIQGLPKTAYDGGKTCMHAYSYGAGAEELSNRLWIPLATAREIVRRLDAKYEGVCERRARLADRVWGVQGYCCPQCGEVARQNGSCVPCSRAYGVPVRLAWTGWQQEPTRLHVTPFGRQRWYRGRRSDGEDALASQDPQSCGASCFYRTAGRLRGYQMVDGERESWPTPGVWGAHGDYRVAWGNYDSFLVGCRRSEWQRVLRWLLWTMEQSWPQLAGLRLPAEGAVGVNAGPWDAEKNPGGLWELPREFAGERWVPLATVRADWDRGAEVAA